MPAEPLISIVFPIKNGMPYLRDAVASLAAQTYRNFEVIVQDGGSTDGSLECLQTVRGLPSMSLVSEPDLGIGQACNRGLSRCRGQIIGTLCTDDMFEPHAFAEVVRAFEQHPRCAVLFGSVRFTTAAGHPRRLYITRAFELVRFMQCEWRADPPTAAAFFFRTLCGKELWFEESMKTCPDYDLFLRLGHLPFVKIDTCLAKVRLGIQSGTCRPEMYEQVCRDKLGSLERYLARDSHTPLTEELRKRATAGIYAWAAATMLWIPGGKPYFETWYQRAVQVAPDCWNLEPILNLTHALHEEQGNWPKCALIRTKIFLHRLGRLLQRI